MKIESKESNEAVRLLDVASVKLTLTVSSVTVGAMLLLHEINRLATMMTVNRIAVNFFIFTSPSLKSF